MMSMMRRGSPTRPLNFSFTEKKWVYGHPKLHITQEKVICGPRVMNNPRRGEFWWHGTTSCTVYHGVCGRNPEEIYVQWLGQWPRNHSSIYVWNKSSGIFLPSDFMTNVMSLHCIPIATHRYAGGQFLYPGPFLVGVLFEDFNFSQMPYLTKTGFICRNSQFL